MDVLIDTSIWSLALRRKDQKSISILNQFKQLVIDTRVQIIGAIRQEILSGISHQEQFIALKVKLKAFEDIVLETHDYETAAEMFNVCRRKGIQGSHIDFLICAVAKNYELAIYTTDTDFTHYKKYLPITLYEFNNDNL